MNSPWGKIDYVKRVARGVAIVSTSSHGGVRVARGFAEKYLSGPAQRHATHSDRNYFWYEEDCNWSIVAHELPHLFPDLKHAAFQALTCWEKDYCEEMNIPRFTDQERAS